MKRRQASTFGIWLEQHGLTANKAADKLGVTPEHIYSMRRRGASVSIKLRLKVRKWTGGVVGLEDW